MRPSGCTPTFNWSRSSAAAMERTKDKQLAATQQFLNEARLMGSPRWCHAGYSSLIKLISETLRRRVAPGGDDGVPDRFWVGGFEANVRASAAPPGALHGHECGWVGQDEHPLLLGREFDHAPALV